MTGTITGRVMDAGGAPLAGVTIRVTSAANGFAREITTSRAGTYVLALVPPGRYDVTFEGAGRAAAVRHLELHVGDRRGVDATLDEAAAVQYLVDARQIRDLPLINRHVGALVATVPGVTSALADEPSVFLRPGEGLVFGARRHPPDWSIDGAPPLLDDVFPLALTPSLESLEEVRIVTASSSATWPRAGGVALVTRSGTNAFRASAYDFHRDSALDANAYFRNHGLDPEERAEPAELHADIFGYSAGGPIRRDTLFLFWSQEWRRRRGEAPSDFVDGRQETGRLDYRAGAHWRLMARYTHDTLEGSRDLGAVRATTVIAPRAVNELTYQTASSDSLRSHGLSDTFALQLDDHALTAGGSFAHRGDDDRFEAFAQDSWRAHRTLAVDLAVRHAPRGFEPAAGVAWTPGRPDLVIRGGFAAWDTNAAERQWFLGLARRLYAWGAVDGAYVGRRSDASGPAPAVRYSGLLAHFRHQGPRALVDVAYTLGRDEFRGAEWEPSRSDRRHVFTATWSRDLGAWTLAGITTFQSGPPAPAVFLPAPRREFAREVSDPFVNLPSDRYYFNPAAFAPPTPDAPGSALSPFSLPGRNQWDVALSRAWGIGGRARVRLRAEVFNLFNHTQFTTVDTACTAAAGETSCAVANTTLGQYTAARAPRQVQLGVRLDWN